MTKVRVHDHRETWDKSDAAALQALLADGLAHAEIALRLGRTVSAVRSKLYRLRRST